MKSRLVDPVWETIVAETAATAASEPMLASFLHAAILNYSRLEDALTFLLSRKLGGVTIVELAMRDVMNRTLDSDPEIGLAVRADLEAVRQRDPACRQVSTPLLYFKGFHALQAYRIAHRLWSEGRVALALHLQSLIAETFSVDIHPAARIGRGILIDHADGLVIGETAVVGDNVSLLHEVTLGGTGKETGDRHPKVRDGVLIGAGAKILGNVTVGEGAKVAACSVVLDDVPPHTTVAGIPAVVVGRPRADRPSLEMNHDLKTNGIA